MNWTAEMINTLRELYPYRSCKYIADQIGTTKLSVKSKAKVLGLSKRKFWTSDELEYLRKHYPDHNTSHIAIHLGKTLSSVFGAVDRLGLEKSEAFRNSPLSGRLKPGAKLGGATVFKKGQVPLNKGLKQSQYMSAEAIARTKATRFKKGQKPHNTKENDGEITIRTCKGRKYQYIRIREGYWRELHRVVWEQHHGKPAKGYNVQFKDGNSLNCVIENLYLIKRKDQMLKNTIQRYPVEVKKAIRTLSKFNRKIKSYEKQN